MVYYAVYYLTKAASFFLFPRIITGHEHIPMTGGVIFASNHLSNLDPMVLGISCKRRLNFMAKDSLFKGFFSWLLPKLGAFPIKRGEADIWALKEALKRLKKGKPVLVFLEGTRQRNGAVRSDPQPGIGFLAVKAGVPVVPVYLEGTQSVMPPGARRLTRHSVRIRFGPQVEYDPKDDYKVIADHILKTIYDLPQK